MPIQSITYGAVQTAYVSSASYEFTAINETITLYWPTPYNTAPYVAAASNNITCEFTGCSLVLPNANEVSLGMNLYIRNIPDSTETFNVRDNEGNLLQTVDPGVVYWVQLIEYVEDETSGVWLFIEQGAGTSQATAAELAGHGLEAVDAKLNTVIPPKIITTNYTIVEEDQSALLITNSAGIIEITLPEFRGGFAVSFNNVGSGNVSFPGVIINNQTSLFAIAPSQTVTLINDSVDTTKWWSLGLGQGTAFLDSITNIDLSDIKAGGNYTLSTPQLNAFIQQFYADGPITGDITIYYGNGTGNWYVANFCETNNGSTINLRAGSQATPVGDLFPIPVPGKIIIYIATDPITETLNIFGVPSVLNLERLLLGDGTEDEPALAFTTDQTSGMYLPDPFTPTIVANGVSIAKFDAIDDENPKLLINPGIIDYPSYTFIGNTAYGMGLTADGLTLFSENTRVSLNTTGITNSKLVLNAPNGTSSISLTIADAGDTTLTTTGNFILSKTTTFTERASTLNALMPTATAGDIVYYNGTDWIALTPGTDGQVLTLASGVPTWA